ncbi:MAG: hypothetical protein TREMPRED_005232 [Tremellales sp. Tagirdzhanova-0007]|nr:MAG: hypothetical protein TREMPRED_005232 [Tremellales sp. Tagirdzhanova-0007]
MGIALCVSANVKNRFNALQVAKVFESLVHARSAANFNDIVGQALLSDFADMINYALAIGIKLWAVHAFPLPRYRFVSSNVVEARNGQIRALRAEPIIQVLSGFWDRFSEQFVARAESAEAANDITFFHPFQALFPRRGKKRSHISTINFESFTTRLIMFLRTILLRNSSTYLPSSGTSLPGHRSA